MAENHFYTANLSTRASFVPVSTTAYPLHAILVN